jgi:hypothetical protein
MWCVRVRDFVSSKSVRMMKLTSGLISVPDVRERAKRRMKAEAKKLKKTHTANLSLTSGAIRP